MAKRNHKSSSVLDLWDEINSKIQRAKGICELAGGYVQQPDPDADAVEWSMQEVQDLLDDVATAAHRLGGLAHHGSGGAQSGDGNAGH